jgi:hypothetical protein
MHSLKQLLPIPPTCGGIENDLSEVHLAYAVAPSVTSLESLAIKQDSSSVQPSNALSSIIVTDAGISMIDNDIQARSAPDRFARVLIQHQNRFGQYGRNLRSTISQGL